MSTEEFWEGDFGTQYTERNGGNPIADRVYWERIITHPSVRLHKRARILELGANKGNNLRAIRRVNGAADYQLHGIEINESAHRRLAMVADVSYLGSFLDNPDFTPNYFDMVFTKGVLIHVAPEDLVKAYEALYNLSSKYIVIGEYYAKEPTPVTYRGHEGKLWRRDFAGELLDLYGKALRVVDYGFVWDRDPHPQDSINWWIFEKVDHV
jgi:pseudaminic acid biosynthesis-associated methylase